MSMIHSLNQQWSLPSQPKPIVIIGAGDIIRDAHLPAYAKADFQVAGLFDVDKSRSQTLADSFKINSVFDSLDEAAANEDVVFDVATPPAAFCPILDSLPNGATVLIQKPMGEHMEHARQIRQICRDKKLITAINFQLRFSPMMLALQDAVDKGLIGDIYDLDIHLNVSTPWEIFPFLKEMERVEIQVHSVHYLDWIRSLLGNPAGVYARTIAHPAYPDLRSTRTSIILEYGDATRCCLSLNHTHKFGPKYEEARIQVEGAQGAAVMRLGLLLDYPKGKPDRLDIITKGQEWTEVSMEGGWFPDAFIGPMANIQRFAAGEDEILHTSVEDVFHTMALVEACYQSNENGATPIPE